MDRIAGTHGLEREFRIPHRGDRAWCVQCRKRLLLTPRANGYPPIAEARVAIGRHLDGAAVVERTEIFFAQVGVERVPAVKPGECRNAVLSCQRAIALRPVERSGEHTYELQSPMRT